MPYANLTTILVQQKETIDGTELKINNTSSDSLSFNLRINKYNENTTSVYIDETLYEAIRISNTITITLSSGEHTILIAGDQYFNFESYFIGYVARQYLSSVKLKITYDTLKNETFQGCTSLRSIVLSNTLTTLGEKCFDSCISLTSLIIPDSVTSIGNNCFKDMSNLQSIKIKATTPPTAGTTIFLRCSNLTKIYVPAGTLSTYQTATNWTAYASKMEEYND